ncbi:hypothetical protein DJ90_4792 [Paenibacillus macerans]|uniref:Uncharacterized protein n=1 Tax=Paenibacillus macerans TaxID=44252 RepID=A0A090Y5K2_PAEMA|nr:hypothetical protein DJ90_4792 [Paenibacillus macerans]
MTIFQSTHSHGVRRLWNGNIDGGWELSIHALTWSATLTFDNVDFPKYTFNPRTHMECDVPKST